MNIVIVDDEDTICLGLTKILKNTGPQYNVVATYENGLVALEQMKLDEIDVVISDIQMPYLDGLELAKELKLRKPELQFIIMSGFNEFEYARTAMRYHVLDYLLKPIDTDELFRILDHIQQPETDDDKKVIRIVKQILDEEYAEPFILSELAESVHLNPTYLSKLFKQETDMTLTDYLIQVRLNKAKEVIHNDMGMKSYEIASLVGYKDSVYFNKLFKKQVGMTVKEYRDKDHN